MAREPAVTADELRAALEARRELGPEHEGEVVDAFLDRVERSLQQRVADLPDDVVWAPARVPQAGGGVVTLAGLGLTHGGPARLTGGTTTDGSSA